MRALDDPALEKIAMELERTERKGIDIVLCASKAIGEIMQITEKYLPDAVTGLIDGDLAKEDALEFGRLAMRITETSNIIHEFLGSNYRFRVSPYIEPSKDGGSKPVEVHNKRVDITKAVRVSVLKRDNYRCQWCGATSFTAELVIDHIVPVARGGKNNIENLRVLCKDCNEGKSSKLDEDI